MRWLLREGKGCLFKATSQTLETSRLSQLMVAMIKAKPELAKSQPSDTYSLNPNVAPRPTSVYSPSPPGPNRHSSVSSRRSVMLVGTNDHIDEFGLQDFDEDDEVQAGQNFTYIPPNPKKFYRRLLEHCLVADLETMLSPEVDDNDQVSLGILSPRNIELINECAVRWRIGQPYRVSCFLDLVKSFYDRNDVPVECVPEALQGVDKVVHEQELSKWPVQDVRWLFLFDNKNGVSKPGLFAHVLTRSSILPQSSAASSTSFCPQSTTPWGRCPLSRHRHLIPSCPF